MEKTRPEHVVLFVDQSNSNGPAMDTELNHLPLPVTDNQKSPKPSRSKTLTRLNFSKPKARLVEYKYPPPNTNPFKTISESNNIEPFLESQHGLSSDDDDNGDDWSEELEEEEDEGWKKYRKKKKFNYRLLTEWIMFIFIMTCLTLSLTVEALKQNFKWGIEIWKWCIMVLVTFCGRLVSAWLMGVIVFLIERNFMLREKVLYFVYGVRKSIQNCVWLSLVLLAWVCMFNSKLHKENVLINKIFQALVAILVAATIWLVKIVLVKMLASSFHVATYFDRMKESVFHYYILDTLSGPQMDEMQQKHEVMKGGSKSMPASWKDGKNRYKSKKYGSRRIDMEELRKLSMERPTSVWSVKRLVNYIRSSGGLSTISKNIDDFGKAGSEITSEWEARSCAQRIFINVAKRGAKYIEEEDLMRFLKRVEIHTIFPLFEGALETGRITKSSFRNWVVRAYIERKALAHSLNDTKTAVQQLHKLASAVVIVVIAVVSLLVMEVATTKVIAFVITQLVLAGFMFHNTCKMIFECIIFIFVMHPFDIGDRCVIDGVQMIVEEMNILTTVFLRYDMEKIYYPNAVLLTRPISNFYRSPEMGEAISFTVDSSTPLETIVALKKVIQQYIESKPKYWSPKHSVIVKGFDQINKLQMLLCVQHTINHQNYGERSVRVSELILGLKNIFEDLNIKYHLLPQEIHLTQMINTDHGKLI
ncbi:hypothetical protein ACFE04_000197 [Oxalis oulophora]